MKKLLILSLFLLSTQNLVSHRDARTHYNPTSTNQPTAYPKQTLRQQHRNNRTNQARTLQQAETEALTLLSCLRYGLGLFCLPI